MKPTIQSVKGTRDFYPEDMAVRNWLVNIIRRISSQFGYQEYDGPFLEKIDLYAAKSGEELVKEQAFVFPDRGGDLITLRPELTPSLARMVAQKQNELAAPLRWWSFGPFWRYERPQKGRTREFFQWNIDLIGANSPEADAELVAVAASFLKAAGLGSDQVSIAVNNRRLMDARVQGLGISLEKRGDVFRLIDRRDKMKPEEWETFATDAGLTIEQLHGIEAMLGNPDLWKESDELQRFFTALEVMGLREYVRYDAGVIRGLDYYTGTVFEASLLNGGGRAILGGGRYDNLVGDVGGEPLSGVGFAMGDVMITVALRELGLIPKDVVSPTPILVTVFDEHSLLETLKMAAELHSAGLCAAVYPETAKLPKQLKYADRMGMRWAVIAGPDEMARNEVTVKDLSARTQASLPRAGWVQAVEKMLAEAGRV